ncbi:hypothetical protein EV183_003016, partial [Coemansia sp. RSA 2336]
SPDCRVNGLLSDPAKGMVLLGGLDADAKDTLLDNPLLDDPLLDDSTVEVAVDVGEDKEVRDSHANSDEVEEPDWDAGTDEVTAADEAGLEVDKDRVVLSESEEDAKKENIASKPEPDEAAAAAGLDVAELKADDPVDVSLEIDKVELVLCLVAGRVSANAADEDCECDVACAESAESISVMMESSVVRVWAGSAATSDRALEESVTRVSKEDVAGSCAKCLLWSYAEGNAAMSGVAARACSSISWSTEISASEDSA